MRRLHKSLIIATIPFALAISGGAAGLGAALQGVAMLFLAVVSIGAFAYVGVVLYLLTVIEAQDRAIDRANERIRRYRNQF